VKRKVITELCIAWGIFLFMVLLIIIESNLTAPWDRITNGLWVISAVALIFFIGKGFYHLRKYFKREIGGNQ